MQREMEYTTQRWMVTGLLFAGLVVSGALGGHLMRQGGGARRAPATAARPCVADAALAVASAASPIVASHPEGTCDAAAKGGD